MKKILEPFQIIPAICGTFDRFLFEIFDIDGLKLAYLQ